jgi:hypothetical protein
MHVDTYLLHEMIELLAVRDHCVARRRRPVECLASVHADRERYTVEIVGARSERDFETERQGCGSRTGRANGLGHVQNDCADERVTRKQRVLLEHHADGAAHA